MKTTELNLVSEPERKPTHTAGDEIQKDGEWVPMRLLAFLGFQGNFERWQVAIASCGNFPCGQALYSPKLPTIPKGQDTGDLFQNQSEDFALVSEATQETEFIAPSKVTDEETDKETGQNKLF